jgi:surface antigen
MAAVAPRNKVRVLARRETICFSQSFEYIPDRKTVAWSDKKVAVYYSVMPLRTLRTSDGHVCREYTAKAAVNGHAADVYGTACRDSDGRWLLID